MKNLKELKGVKVLSKKEQKDITGGLIFRCEESWDCLVLGNNYCCADRICKLSIYPCQY